MNNDNDERPRTIEDLTKLAFQGAIESPSLEELEESGDETSETDSTEEKNIKSEEKNNQEKTQKKNKPATNDIENEAKENVDNNVKQKVKTPNKSIKIKIFLIGIAVLALVGFILANTVFAPPTLRLNINDELTVEDIDKLIKDQIFLYSQKNNGINLMYISKEEGEYYINIKRKIYTIDENYKYEITYGMIKSKIEVENGLIKEYSKDDIYRRPLTISNKKSVFTLETSSGETNAIEEMKNYLGEYRAVKRKKGYIEIPMLQEDKYAGEYLPKDKKTGSIYVVYNDKKDEYNIEGKIIQEDKSAYVYGSAKIEDDKATSTDNVEYKFNKDSLTVISAPPEARDEIIKGKYKKAKLIRARIIIDELENAINMINEGYIG